MGRSKRKASSRLYGELRESLKEMVAIVRREKPPATVVEYIGPIKTRVHYLKTWSSSFVAVADGCKPYELRKDDRFFAVGDYVVLTEWNPVTKKYSGRAVKFKIGYITRHGEIPGLRLDFCILGISDLSEVYNWRDIQNGHTSYGKQLLDT